MGVLKGNARCCTDLCAKDRHMPKRNPRRRMGSAGHSAVREITPGDSVIKTKGARISIGSLAAACLTVLLSAALMGCAGRTFDLSYENFENGTSPLGGAGDQWLMPLDAPPKEIKAAPEALSGSAKWFSMISGNGAVLLVVDPDPLKLYVDTDRDGDLSDEEAITDSEDEGRFRRFAPVSVHGRHPESPVRFTVSVHITEDVVDYVSISPAGGYSSKVTLGADTYKIFLVDSSYDGSPDDAFTLGAPNDYDRVAIDFDGDGGFNPSTEIMPLPAVTMFDGVHYNVIVAKDGSTISFKKAKPRTGTLKTAPEAMMTLLSDAGVFRIHAGEDTWKLPVGRYQVTRLDLIKHDDEGNRWTAGCLSPNEAEYFEIRKGETTVLNLGPPLTFHTRVAEDEEGVSINLELLGKGGERYFPYPRTNAKGVGDAKLKILDENGAEIGSGEIEYG